MSKLAGRLTYLGFGILAGTAIAAAALKHDTISNIFPDNPELWVACITAITGAFSAVAAWQAASIARMAQSSATRKRNVRVNAAKQVIRNLYIDLVESRKEPGDEIFHQRSTITFSEPAKLLSIAIDEPVDDEEHTALWRAIHVLQSIEKLLERDGYVANEEADGAIKVLEKSMRGLGIDIEE